MRVNVYSEELTPEVQVTETVAKTGKAYPGVRFVLDSSKQLHHKPDDDDRSAVTFWFHDLNQAHWFFVHALREIEIAKNIDTVA